MPLYFSFAFRQASAFAVMTTFFGDDCSLDITLPPLIDPGFLHILCDGCGTSIIIVGSNFCQVETLMCEFTQIEVS